MGERTSPDRWFRAMTADVIVFIAAVATIGTIAGVLVIRVPHNRVSWVLLAVTVGFLVMSLSPLLADGPEGAVSGVALFALVLPGFGVFVPLWFPTGAPPTLGWRWVGWLGVVAPATLLTGAGIYSFIEGREALETIDSCVSPGACVMLAGNALTLAAIMCAIASLVVRWVRSAGVERQQLKWLIAPFMVFGIGALAEFGGWQDSVVASIGLTGGLVLIPTAIGVAILKYRLYELDRIISRTVSYTLVIGLLGLVYAAGAVWLPTQVLSGRSSPLFVAASTLAVAALFNPVRRRVTGWVDRRFYRTRYNAEHVTEAFSNRLRTLADMAPLTQDWVEAVWRTVQPSSVGVWVRTRS